MKRIGFDWSYGAQLAARDDWQRDATGYTVTISYERRRAKFDYWTGPAITDDPTLESVMYCLAGDALAGTATFASFCDEFGYDEDSRRAHATWEACRETLAKLRRVFGDDLDQVLAREWDA